MSLIAFDSAVLAAKETLVVGHCRLWFFDVANPNTVDVWLQLFDALLADVTVGTTAPTMSLQIPAGASASLQGGRSEPFAVDPPEFMRGICYAITTTSTGSTAPGAACSANFTYHMFGG